MALTGKCELHIPYKNWATRGGHPSEEEKNYLAIERWASNFHKNCLPAAGGGGSALALYSTKEWEFVSTEAVVSWSVTIPEELTIVCSWNWYSDGQASNNIRAYGEFDSFQTRPFGNDFNYDGDFSAEVSGSFTAVAGVFAAGSYLASLTLWDTLLSSGEFGNCSLTVLGFNNISGGSIS